MTEPNDDLAQLLAIVNNEEEGEELTEEELQQAIDSPTLHQNAIECDEESTECDEYENSDGLKFDNNNNNECDDKNKVEVSSTQAMNRCNNNKRNEYQFQMMDHHIFKGKHGKKLYKCDVCFAVYRHSFSLKRHFIRSHINYGYLCETDVTNCGINLDSSASLQTWNAHNSDNHLENSPHDLPELYCCHSCVLFYDELSQIKSHVDDCHRNTKSGSIEPIRIPCSECNMSFIQRHNLMRHIEVVHHGRKLYGCKHCAKKFQTIADRKKHEKSQHKSQSEESTRNKTHCCVRCSQICSSYSEFRKHVTKKHKELYNPCAFCTKFMFTKKQLNEHLRQKHEKSAKDNTEKLKLKKKSTFNVETSIDETVEKAILASNMSSQSTHQAYFHCSLCYRRFLTYGSLIRHKQIAHRPQVRHCSRLTAQTHVQNEIIQPLNQSNEMEFYQSLAQRIAENLLYFVDGKFVNTNTNGTNDFLPFPKRNTQINNQIDSHLNLVKYNFPEDFDCSSPSVVNADKLDFLLDCNLNTVAKTNVEMSAPSEAVNDESLDTKPIFICTACHEKISPDLLAEHEANNHPNVYCTYLEVDSFKTIPSRLLLWQHHCSEGLLHKCPVAPSTHSSGSLKCTKCSKSFSSVNLLHNHILECAHNMDINKKSVTNKIDYSECVIPASTETCINTNSTNSKSTNNQMQVDFASPLSPCKTRSGKRRQISPEDIKPKKSRTGLKNSDKGIKQTERESNVEDVDHNYNNDKVQEMKDETDGNQDSNRSSIVDDISLLRQMTEKSVDNVPKRYACEKCSKKFVYMDSLKKHQLSCKRVYNAKPGAKGKIKSISRNNKLVLKIEMKAIKHIKRNEQKKINVSKKSSFAQPKCQTDNQENQSERLDLESKGDQNENQVNKDESTHLTLDSDVMQNISSSLELSNTPLQEHRCPDCLRVFTYTANFRKHIKNVCPVRKQLTNEDTSEGSTLTSPVKRYNKESTVSDLKTVVIKQEIDVEQDIDNVVHPINSNVITDEDIVFEGETPVEENTEEEYDGIDIIASKDDLKLDLWRVKQENPMFAFKGSPAQHHSCPYCQRGFTYLANYRKHIKSICPIRQQIEEKKKQVMEDNSEEVNGVKIKSEHSVPTMAYTPSSLSVRSQIEDTVLTLLRDQTKQDQILQSSEELIKSKANDESGQSNSEITAVNTKSNNNEMTDESLSTESDKTKDLKKEMTSPSGKGSSYRFRTFSCNICHKIFLSYVTMLKHRLSHKLSDGSAIEDNSNSVTNESSDDRNKDNNNELIKINHDKEIQNQALAASLLKRSKDTIFSKMRGNSAKNNSTIKPVINTTELLEKLARGGITTDSLQLTKSKENGQEIIVGTNFLANASTSSSSLNNNDNNLQEIIIDTNNLNDLELDVLKDGVIVQDLQSLISSETNKLPVNQVLLDIDPNEIGSSNELWITFTDSSAFVQVPETNNNNNSDNNTSNQS